MSLEWLPMEAITAFFQVVFIDVVLAGDNAVVVGMAAHAYTFDADMVDDYFFNADGELLVVPQLGAIRLRLSPGARTPAAPGGPVAER